MPTWSGIMQGLESGKDGEPEDGTESPVRDGTDQVVVQGPVKSRYEQAWLILEWWGGVGCDWGI